jgi:hypothetical protein
MSILNKAVTEVIDESSFSYRWSPATTMRRRG